ncbi:MAG: DUF4956 domain-containing protein [Eubacteriales bacterium]
MSLNTMFESILDSSTTTTSSIPVSSFFLCTIISLLLGVFISFLYTYKTKHTKSFVLTLAILPAVVSMVIMMVNGSIGTGVAVAGAFSLIRFRSVPGTAKEIGAIFLAMGAGLAVGIGYVAFAILFVLIVSLMNLLLTLSSFGDTKKEARTLTITIPEDLDYTSIFEDLFSQYTTSNTLNRVRTTNMGSLFKLTYDIELIDEKSEKKFIDDLRCRNGNLEIIMAKQSTVGNEL